MAVRHDDERAVDLEPSLTDAIPRAGLDAPCAFEACKSRLPPGTL